MTSRTAYVLLGVRIPDQMPSRQMLGLGWCNDAQYSLDRVRFLVLQHATCEPPGTFETLLDAEGHTFVRVELDAGDVLPDWRAFDGIVAMGGPMSVNDVNAHPWLLDELRAIGEAVRAGLPYWGVCLGAQLLAAALGATVRQSGRPEVGVIPVSLASSASADPVFSACPTSFIALHWHSDTFDLPPEAVLLASTAQYPHQALRWGQVAYGLQFHVETDAALAKTWLTLDAYRQALMEVAGPSGPQDLMAAIRAAEREMRDVSTDLFNRWLRLSDKTAIARGRPPTGSPERYSSRSAVSGTPS